MDYLSMILTTLLWVFIAGAVIIGLFIFALLSQYKHKVTLKIDTRNGKRVKLTSAKELDNGKWKLLYKKKEIVAPPEDAIEINDKGKLHATVYISKDDSVSFQIDEWIFREIPDEIKKLRYKDKTKYEELLENWRKENRVIPAKPFTPAQKGVLIRQEQKREEWKKNNVYDMIRNVAPIMAMVVIILSLLIFYGSIAEPVLASGARMDSITQKQLEIAKTQEQTMEIISNLIKEKQIISGTDIINEINEGEENNES